MRQLPTVFCCVLLAALSVALKNCQDCVTLRKCLPALELYQYKPAAYQKMKNSTCGFADRQRKVCCSDFSSTPILTEKNNNENNTQINEEEIENHRNIHLLPAECGQTDGDISFSSISAGLYEFPWMALISYRRGQFLKFRCVGTVISARYVLTQAVCVRDQEIAGVRIGDYDISKTVDCVGENESRKCESKYQDIGVTLKIPHPDFKTLPFIKNDIGLLRLATPVDFSYRNAGAICLPIKKYQRGNDVEGEIGVLASWNFFFRHNENKTSFLHKDMLPILSKTECITKYSELNGSSDISSQSRDGRMTDKICTPDSVKINAGAPLMLAGIYDGLYKSVQFGIFSHGPKVIGTKPALYTDVRKYVKWILDTIEAEREEDYLINMYLNIIDIR